MSCVNAGLRVRILETSTVAEQCIEYYSFCCCLGGAMYYTTLPTDSLMRFRDVLLETESYGIEKTKENMWDLGNQIRSILVKNGFKSVSAPGNQSPGVKKIIININFAESSAFFVSFNKWHSIQQMC